MFPNYIDPSRGPCYKVRRGLIFIAESLNQITVPLYLTSEVYGGEVRGFLNVVHIIVMVVKKQIFYKEKDNG